MKKILFVTNFFGNGGAARVMSTISEYLASKKNYDVSIVSFIKTDNEYSFSNKINFFNLKSQNKIKRIIELRKIIRDGKYDIVISFEYFINMYTIIANFFMKNKLIISERNDPKRSGNNRKHIRNFLYKFSDILVCQTNDAKAYFPLSIQKKSIVIPNPIMDDLPKRYEGKRTHDIVNFCRLTSQKNIPLLIDAFEIVHKKHNDYRLIIYGDGAIKQELQEYINDKMLEKYVQLKPFEKDIHNKIIKCAMFVSSSDYEGISNSMIEAMGIGLPTICTDCPCGGAKMMINNRKNGILVPVGDCKKLADAMLEVIDNEKLQKCLSVNAIKIKEDLRTDIICKKWEDLL